MLTSKTKSGSDAVFEALLTAIKTGEFPGGTLLKEQTLSDNLGTSRVPVREALRRLQGLGLVENVHGRGLSVVKPELEYLSEAFVAREFLEGALAREAAVNATSTQISAMREIIEADKAATNGGETKPSPGRFQRQIAMCSSNRFLVQALEQLRLAMTLMPRVERDHDRRRAIVAEHERILEAIERKSPLEAERAARQHIANSFAYYRSRLT